MAKEKERKGFGRTLESFSQRVAKRTGGSWAFIIALTVIVISVEEEQHRRKSVGKR